MEQTAAGRLIIQEIKAQTALREVGGVSFLRGQGSARALAFASTSAVHAPGPAGEPDETGPLHRRSAGEGFLCLGDLLVEAPALAAVSKPDGDLLLQPAVLGEPRLPELVTSIDRKTTC
jgi:hypothetical protein